jgi:hypothetical protein
MLTVREDINIIGGILLSSHLIELYSHDFRVTVDGVWIDNRIY